METTLARLNALIIEGGPQFELTHVEQYLHNTIDPTDEELIEVITNELGEQFVAH